MYCSIHFVTIQVLSDLSMFFRNPVSTNTLAVRHVPDTGNIGETTSWIRQKALCHSYSTSILHVAILVKEGSKHVTILAIIAKYGVPITQRAWLYQALLLVSTNKIAL